MPTDRYHRLFEKTIAAVLKEAKGKVSAEYTALARQFFARMPFTDLERLEPKQAAAILASCHAFLKQRAPGEQPKIRIYTPGAPEATAKRSHTAIQLLNHDKPFLVDSLSAELTRQGFTIYETLHPQIGVTRDAKGKLTGLVEDHEECRRKKDASVESLIYFLVSPLPEDVTPPQLQADLEYVLDYVSLAVADWKKLLSHCEAVRRDVSRLDVPTIDKAQRDEGVDFLGWLMQGNFVFLGHVEYRFFDKAGKEKLSVVGDSELGIFRAPDGKERHRGLASIPKEMQHFALTPQVIEITKSSQKSIVHRPAHMDYVSIKKLDAKGKVIGEHRFLGLFTSIVYYERADGIPFIRRKIARTLERADFAPASHNAKALTAILEFFPRDELFQISEDDLYAISLGVMSLEARPEVGLFLRRDKYERFVSAFVYMPRDKFNTFVRREIAGVLERALDGKVSDFYTQLTESPLARVHYVIRTNPGHIPKFDHRAIQQEIALIVNFWIDSLREILVARLGDAKGESLYRIFRDAFPKHYINVTPPETGFEDIHKVMTCIESGRPEVNLFRLPGDEGKFHLKLYTAVESATLSEILPVLENMGCRVMDVVTFPLTANLKTPVTVTVRDFHLTLKDSRPVSLHEVKALFEEALVRVWCGEMENDGYNALVLCAGLDWRQVTLLRAYGKYLRQAGLSYSEGYVASALAAHPLLSAQLVGMFMARFDPARGDGKPECEEIGKRIMHDLAEVGNLAEDRIIRRFSAAIMATLRTNYFQTGEEGGIKPYVSFKFRSADVPGLPLPLPYAEIFVYSLRTEGIHLRGGKVARGGLRWSDRHEDFRTEVLGLMKAQMVKNAVIVPVGSKGGFVVKCPPTEGGRAALQEEGIFCYRQFLSGLLDITDNIVNGRIVHPKQVVLYDDDDPYLVVAADKGTASFSDIANGLSESYLFWLGDAFASGGSVGYDHKAMGITARGAWVSVERHFHEAGKDISKEDFTVAGIGDMGGDVFGNGMLLSKHIRLVAAFNHRHIFFDPSPDAAASFKERKRLFKDQLGWDSYNKQLISKGGGIFERSAKNITLSKEIQTILDTGVSQGSPDEVIRLILKSPVDLLWNGGIGTYVKSEAESNEAVGDRANDSLRVNGSELRCKVVGEGGNLGFTQRGRIEYARNGGKLNTDAIDNSAGVDCSDHEVNIKIALTEVERRKKLTRKQRNTLLEQMTGEVAELVLRDNRLQTQAITIAERQGYDALEAQARMIRTLEKEGRLNRAVEFLPSDRDLQQMRAEKRGLTRPELAVLLSYAKLSLYDDVLDSKLPDSDYFAEDLLRYFPDEMSVAYEKEILSHRLRREIIATSVTNSIINRAGITFFHTVMRDTGRKGCDIARAYTATRDAFGLREWWQEIEALDGKIPAEAQAEMFNDVNRLLERGTVWFLRNCPQPLDMGYVMREYADGIRVFAGMFPKIISPVIREHYQSRQEHLVRLGTPAKLAAKIAGVEALNSACDVVLAANKAKLSVEVVGRVYYQLGKRLHMGWLRSRAHGFTVDSPWDKIAIKGIITDLFDEQRRLSLSVIENMCKDDVCAATVEDWYAMHKQPIDRYLGMIDELRSSDMHDISMLFVALKQVRMVGALPLK